MRIGYTSMELRHLRYFVMAAEEANISRAASRLNVSQPAVSRQIKDLEEELGLPLFHRESSGLRLTEAGESALAHAREVLRHSGAMVDAMKAFSNQNSRASVKVGFLPTALPGFLADGLRKFNRQHQDVCVQIYEMTPSEQEKALREGDIDLALIGEACPELRRDFEVATMRKTEMAIVVPDDHRLAKRKAADLAELSEESFLTLHEAHFPGRPEMLAGLFSRAGINPEVTIRARGLSELLGLVGGGAGVAVAPADLDQLPHHGVVFLKMRKPRMSLLFSGAWRKSAPNSAVETLVRFLQDATARREET